MALLLSDVAPRAARFRRRPRRGAVCAVLLIALATVLPHSTLAQGLLGTVTDSVGRALVGAEVTVLSDSLVVRTGTDGRFAFRHGVRLSP